MFLSLIADNSKLLTSLLPFDHSRGEENTLPRVLTSLLEELGYDFISRGWDMWLQHANLERINQLTFERYQAERFRSEYCDFNF